MAMTEDASVFDDHGDVTKISALPHSGFNPDFHGNANNGKGIDAAVPQRDVQWCTLKRRHGDLIENGLARQGLQLGNQSEPRRVPQEPALDSVSALPSLPAHRPAKLRHPHTLDG